MSQQVKVPKSPKKTWGNRGNMVTSWKRSSTEVQQIETLKVPPRKAPRLNNATDPSPGLVSKLESLTFNEGKKVPAKSSKKVWQQKNWRKANQLVVKRSTQLTEPVEFNLHTEGRYPQQQQILSSEYTSMQKFCDDYWKMTPERFLRHNSVWAGKLQAATSENARPPRLATSMLNHSRPPMKSSEERELEQIANMKPFKARELDPRIYNRKLKVKQKSKSSNVQQVHNGNAPKARENKQQNNSKDKHWNRREQEVTRKKEQWEEEKENTSSNTVTFKALPMPTFHTPQLPKVAKQAPVKPVPFSLATDRRHNLHAQNSQVSNNIFEFKAHPLPMTTYEPHQFQLKPKKKLVSENIVLNSDKRAEERQQYEARVLQQKKTEDLKKKFEDLENMKREQDQLREYRKNLEFHAQPMPDLSEPNFKPDFSKSQAVTVAVSPVFGKKKKRQDSFDEAELKNLHQSILQQLGSQEMN